MELWQEKLAFDAEEAANACHVCGRYGHYPVDCPLLGSLRQKPTAPEEAPSGYIVLVFSVIAFILGMLLMRGLMS